MISRKVTIVTYHYVRNLGKSRYPEIRGLEKDHFINQLNYFKSNYTFVSMPEIVNALDKNKGLPENALLLTFNDNYADHFLNVFPVLNDLNISGCFFPEIRAIEEPIVLPNHKIHYILASAENPQIIVKRIFQYLDEFRDSNILLSNEKYYQKLADGSGYDSEEVVFIKRILQNELQDDISDSIVDNLFKEFVNIPEAVLSKELYMSKDQIKCMSRHGMNFGVIGYSHRRLTDLPANELNSEIERSVTFFRKNEINPEMITISYPWNQTSDKVIEVIQNKDIKAGFIGGSEVTNLDIHNRYCLPRFDTNDFPKTHEN